MQWDDYVTFTRQTAIYPQNKAASYLCLGLFSEVGEVAGKWKKVLRDGAPNSWDALLDELGDCFWYIARLEDTFDVSATVDENTQTVGPTTFQAMTRELLYVCNLAGLITYGDPDDLRAALRSRLPTLAALLCGIANSPMGSSVTDVLQRNHDKLLSRQERGTLRGSGDAR